MIYILTILLFILGVGYHVTKVIDRLRKKYPALNAQQVMQTYFNEDWNTLVRSFLVLCTYEIFLFIVRSAPVNMPIWWQKYLVDYALAIVLGYAGQRLIYKYLGTAEKTLEGQAEKLNGKL